MIEAIVEFLQTLPPWGILAVAFFVAWVEHVFPPSPSDVLLVFAGTLIGIGTVGFVPMVVVSTIGSTLGFGTAYWLGRRYGMQIVASRWVPFLTPDLMARVNRWFERYHGLVIVLNRFMAGTRAVIAFAAGIAKLPFPRTVVYCTLSAAAWNTLLLFVGSQLGSRWREADGILATYGWVVTGILVLVIGVVIWRRRKKATA